MSTPHVIRLRDPWQRELLSRGTTADDRARTVRCTRRFNWLANLDSGERVRLVCDSIDRRATFTLNGRPIATMAGPLPCPTIDITDTLAASNVLEIDVDVSVEATAAALAGAELPGGLGQVRLEIGRDASSRAD